MTREQLDTSVMIIDSITSAVKSGDVQDFGWFDAMVRYEFSAANLGNSAQVDILVCILHGVLQVVAEHGVSSSVKLAAVRLLVEQGCHDPEIAERLGMTPGAVRGIRRRAGVPGHTKPRSPSGWQEKITVGHGLGFSTQEIAEQTGYSVRTVQQYLWKLGLSANRENR